MILFFRIFHSMDAKSNYDVHTNFNLHYKNKRRKHMLKNKDKMKMHYSHLFIYVIFWYFVIFPQLFNACSMLRIIFKKCTRK
jgi:hypothetical protein